ncbi:MAG: right-handed parallel beta-helix repeat-containing protein [Thermoplasmata archaeon]|nr:MAG: right-handed parallel beta-helix repeat-containing protein [Thermoplasmata archaeon]
MSRKIAVVWLSCLLILSFIVIISDIAPSVTADIIYVDDDYPIEDATHKKTIQAAIDAAQEGDTVFVYNGSYSENVVVDKTINLTGISKDNTTIVGPGGGDVVYVDADWVNITGFRMTNGGNNYGDAGIKIYNSAYVNISNCTASSNKADGINLIQSNNVFIADCEISSNSDYGMHIYQSTDNIIRENLFHSNNFYALIVGDSNNNIIYNNNVSNPKYGIYVHTGQDNEISRNDIHSNERAILVTNSDLNLIDNNTIRSNTVNGIVLEMSEHNTIYSNELTSNAGWGICLQHSNFTTILNNNITNQGDKGIFIYYSHTNFLIGNNIISGSSQGIFLLSSSGNTMNNNNIFKKNNGIYLLSSSSNQIASNNVSMSSSWAIYLEASSGNNITNNNVSNNYYDGIIVHESSNNNNITGNDVYSNNNEGIIIYSSSYNEITNNNVFSNYYTGISVYSSSSNNNISNNHVHSNTENGIYLSSSSYNNITHNNVSKHENGIDLHQSPYNNVTDNTIFSNTNCGIHIWSSSNTDIVGNTISDNGRGVVIFSSPNNNILGNIILNNWHSIYLASGSSNNVINNNSLLGNLVAIYAVDSPNIDARYNYFGTGYENRVEKLVYSNVGGGADYSNWLQNRESKVQYIDGTVTWDSPVTLNRGVIVNGTLTISSNVTFDNPYGHNFIHVNGSMNIDFANFTSNAGEYAIIYLNDTSGHITNSTFIGQKFVGSHREGFDIKGNTFTSGRDGLDLWKAKYNNITANNISMNRAQGIYLHFSQKNNLTDNDILNNNFGIRVYQSSINNNIQDNNISWSSAGGLEVTSSSNNTITKNSITSNAQGIVTFTSNDNTITKNNILYNNNGIMIISSSSNNRIYHNNIIKNINQGFDTDNVSYWNDSYPSGGNFWSDYTGVDDYQGPDQDIPGNDGIGDSPYAYIAGGSGAQDYYPLMYPVGNYLFLYKGWNLISIPFVQFNNDLNTILSPIMGSFDAVQWYNATDTSDHWEHYHISKPSHLNDLDTISHTISFWIHITEPNGVLFEYSGTPPVKNQTITLHPGWNMVGYPSLIRYNRTVGLNNLTFDTHVDAIWTYNAAAQRWKKLGESDYFEIGRGYYIHAKSECEWEVPL